MKKTKKSKMKKAEKIEISEEELAYNEWMQLFACDDPYWKFPRRYVDFSRLMGHAKKIESFREQYSDYIEDLLSGVPTYYCVLCVSKNDPPDVIKEAYQRKIEHSEYPNDVIERACEILSDRKKRSDYEEILRLFLKLMQGYTAKDKRELIEEHDEWLEYERDNATVNYIIKHRGAWLNLYHLGAPTLYELLGVDREKLKAGEVVQCKNEGVDPRLAKDACRILNNPQLRFEYDFMLDRADEILPVEYLMDDERRNPVWAGDDRSYLVALRCYEDVRKQNLLMGEHIDWMDYTGDKTFYDVLTIDRDLIPEDKREAERFIRNVYKGLERTPEVNRAYSVLKNSRMRSDYDWILKQAATSDALQEIAMTEPDDTTLNKIIDKMLSDADRE
ncbi:MAG: Chaperone protein DnaJ [Candidatus Methanogaster sp.]|nr:MAG: Chaperone protein DnaJ [ANME-2 cluster archaeon]